MGRLREGSVGFGGERRNSSTAEALPTGTILLPPATRSSKSWLRFTHTRIQSGPYVDQLFSRSTQSMSTSTVNGGVEGEEQPDQGEDAWSVCL